LVVTGEGFLDEQSFRGKVVGGIVEFADDLGVPCLVVVGQVYGEHDVSGDVTIVSLVERYGEERAMRDTTACIEDAVASYLAR